MYLLVSHYLRKETLKLGIQVTVRRYPYIFCIKYGLHINTVHITIMWKTVRL